MRWRAAGTDWPVSPRDSSDRIACSIPPAPVGARISGYILDSSKRRGGPAHGVFVGSLRGIHRSSTDLVPSMPLRCPRSELWYQERTRRILSQGQVESSRRGLLQATPMNPASQWAARRPQSLRRSDTPAGASPLSGSRSDRRRRDRQTARMRMRAIADTTPTRRILESIPKRVSGHQPGVVPDGRPAGAADAAGAQVRTVLLPSAGAIGALASP